MTDMDEGERLVAIKKAVKRSFDACQSAEMTTPEALGADFARFAFEQALDREKQRKSRRRSK